MKYLYLFITLSIAGLSCSGGKKALPVNQGAGFKFMLDLYHKERFTLFPLDATYAGDTLYNHLLPNHITEGYRADLRYFCSRYLDSLKEYPRHMLETEEQISYDILEWECKMTLEGLKFPTHLTPINQFNSLILQMGQFAGGTGAQPFKTVKDYENWLQRMDALADWCYTARENMREGIKQKHVLPRALTLKVIPQMEEMASDSVETHLFYSPVKLLPENFSTATKERLSKAYHDMVKKRIIPAFKELAVFFKEEYLPFCRSSAGIWDTPGGKEFYALQIKYFTTTDMTPDEVFALGEKEVARISAEMEKVKEAVGFKGDLKSFFNHVRTKKELMPFSDPSQVIDQFDQIHERMKPNLAKLFDLVPQTGFEVRRTEAFREKSASAEYSMGSTDGKRPGIFYVPVPNVKEYNNFSDEDLFLHEAIPGHHYQISLQQENEKLPEFRRILWYNAYGEGWALYAESLGKELGLYTDPYQYFGMLSAEMHRAIRLVVDVGIHHKGWTRDQAIQYSLDHEAESEAGIVAEIERYMSWPGQALSYKIGQLKIRELRSMAEQKLGDKFRIKEFHNKVLESGCLPLKTLEEKMTRWVESKK